MAGLSQTETWLEGLELVLEMTPVFLHVFLSVGTTPIVNWLFTEIPARGHVGFDPLLFSVGKFFLQSVHLSTAMKMT